MPGTPIATLVRWNQARTTTGRDLGRVAVSVVLPCFNEADSVGLCVKEARDALAGAGIVGEVVVVDNGSTDGSGEVAEAAGARVIHEARRGYGSALRAGFAAAEGDIIVMADADSTYDLTKIPDLVAPVQAMPIWCSGRGWTRPPGGRCRFSIASSAHRHSRSSWRAPAGARS